MDVIQSPIEPRDRLTYRQRKEEAAKRLDITVRSVERLLKKYREQGLIALTQSRSDRGQTRISEEWKEFILNTYREGNQGSKRVLRHQMTWQDKNGRGCAVHGVRLLSGCINCKTPFPIPALWENGKCRHCGLEFAKMAKHQKPIDSIESLN